MLRIIATMLAITIIVTALPGPCASSRAGEAPSLPAQPANTWIKLSPLPDAPVSPRLGYEGACVWASLQQLVVRYGGHNQGGGGEQGSEVWTFDLRSALWTLKLTAKPIETTSFVDDGVDLESPKAIAGQPAHGGDLHPEQVDATGHGYHRAVFAYRVRAVRRDGKVGGPSPAVFTTTKAFHACRVGLAPTVGSTWHPLLRNCGTFRTFAT